MKIKMLVVLAFTVACTSDPPLHALGSHSTATASSSSAGVGGSGGVGGECVGTDAGTCDPWKDPCCCALNSFCVDTTCEVNKQLCGGQCVGFPNPGTHVACQTEDGVAGFCSQKTCSPTIGTGGAAGAGGNGGSAGDGGTAGSGGSGGSMGKGGAGGA